MTYVVTKKNDDVLMHHGIQGMHWGIRRYQNNDGTLTAAGKARYGTTSGAKEIKKALYDLDQNSVDTQQKYKDNEIGRQKYLDKYNKSLSKGKTEKAKKFKTKSDAFEKERNKNEKELKAIDNKLNAVINQALKDGYDIKMSQVQKISRSEKKFAFGLGLAAGGLGAALSIPYSVAMNSMYKRHGMGSMASEGYSFDVKPGTGLLTEKPFKKRGNVDQIKENYRQR